MSTSKKPTAAENLNVDGSRNKNDKDRLGEYTPKINALLEIWTVLAASDKPLTASEIGAILEKNKHFTTSPQTAERRLDDSIDDINTFFPYTVLHDEDTHPILHTYAYDGKLHVVVEDSSGIPLWSGDMTAVFRQGGINPVPKPTVNRVLKDSLDDFDSIKNVVKEKERELKSANENQQKNGRQGSQKEVTFPPNYPPLSLAAIVNTKDKHGQSTVLSSVDYSISHPGKKSPPRRFYLESILSPEEWQVLFDTILVYPYISRQKTEKLLSAMRRMAPGSRQWNSLVYAPKTPNAIRFDFIRQLEDAIQKRLKVNITYGRYQLAHEVDGWHPQLQPDGHGRYVTHPYGLTWSNGYYYLVGESEEKDEYGKIRHRMRNFRVDRILDIKTSAADFTMPDDFDIYQYRDQSPVMYPGEAVPITLRCHTRMLSTLMDFFGHTDVTYSQPKDDYTIVTLNASEAGTKLFAMQYAERVEVLKPQSLRDEVAAALKSAAAKYQ